MKWFRIELSKLQEHLKEENYYGTGNKLTLLEDFGILDLIKQLEERKQKVDADIQNINIREKL